MGKHNLNRSPSDMLLGRITLTEKGWPAKPEMVLTHFPFYHPSLDVDGGWYWIPCSKGSSDWIRVHGHHAVGTLLTTFIPPQVATEIDERVRPDTVPVITTQAYVEYAMAHGRGPHAG